MLKDTKTIEAIRDADHLNRVKLNNRATTLRSRLLDNLEKEHNALREKIDKLIEKKGDVLRGPASKADFVLATKEQWKNERQYIKDFLITHMADCQQRSEEPFSAAFAKHLLEGINGRYLFFYIIDEKDIDDMAASLPEIGLSAKQKEKRIKELDEEINQLAAQLPKEEE
jgi:hypothetical protein